jgi:hypothetical protein
VRRDGEGGATITLTFAAPQTVRFLVARVFTTTADWSHFTKSAKQ